jgi:hypothetical protein
LFPARGAREPREEVHARHVHLARHVRNRGGVPTQAVAAQHVEFGKQQILKPAFHVIGSRVEARRAFKRYGSTEINLYSPHRARQVSVGGGVVVVPLGLAKAVPSRGVAEQVEGLKKQNFETSFSLHRLKGCETGRFQAMGQLDCELEHTRVQPHRGVHGRRGDEQHRRGRVQPPQVSGDRLDVRGEALQLAPLHGRLRVWLALFATSFCSQHTI